jgi:HK97 family phage major capsid protein
MLAGATVVPMTSSTLRVPRKLFASTPAWKAEAQAASVVDSLAFDSVLLTARTLVGFARASIELFEDVQNLQSIIEDDLGAALANALDTPRGRASSDHATIA